MNGEQTQADSFNNFWIATWSAWRTGQLDFLLPSLSRCAEGPFETFGRLGDVYPGKAYPMIQTCFASFPPLDGEYLVYTISVRKDELSMLITNMRVWVFDDPDQNLHCINISDIADYRISAEKKHVYATFALRDGTQHRFGNSKLCDEGFFNRILKKRDSSEGLPPCPPIEVARKLKEHAVAIGEVTRGRYKLYGLIGLIVGVVLAVAIGPGDEGFLVKLAVLGTLFGELFAYVDHRNRLKKSLRSMPKRGRN
jgi:hypothetical protein